MPRHTWSFTPASSQPLRVLWYAGVAVWAGFGLLVAGLAAAVAVTGLLAAVVRRTDSPPGDRSDRGSNRLVRALFAACGLGALSLVVAFQLLDAVPRVGALWGSAVLGTFGGLFR